MAKNFWENDSIVQPAESSKLPWENDSIVQPAQPVAPVTLSPEEQMMSSVGEGSGTEFKDIGKLAAASAVKSVLGSPEAVQAAGSGMARDAMFKPTEALNFLSDPRKLTGMLTDIPGQISENLSGTFGGKPAPIENKTAIIPESFVNKQRIALDEALTKGKIQSLRDVTKYGAEISKMIEDTVSPEMKEALANTEPTGNILKALDQKAFGVKAGDNEISFGKAPSAQGLFGQAARVFGSAAPGVLTSFITKSATPGAVFGFGQAGGEGIETAREHISKMSDIQLAKESEYYRNLLVLGIPPKEARAMTEDKAADTAAYYQGMVGALGGAFTGNLVAGKFDATKLLNAKNVLTRIAKGTTVGMTEEGAQELAEGIATDLGINRTVVREIGVDSFANAVLGAIGGGGPGAVSGALAKPDQTSPSAPPGAASPSPSSDTVRVYHGGNPEKETGPLWGTTSLQDAEGWASRSPDMKVWYVDVPKTDPRIAKYMGDLKNGIAPSSRFNLPEDLASAIKPLQTKVPTKMAEITADELEEEAPIRKSVTPVRVENPTFDEWRTSQGLMFGSKEDYEAALPKLQAQYEAEVNGVTTEQAKEPEKNVTKRNIFGLPEGMIFGKNTIDTTVGNLKNNEVIVVDGQNILIQKVTHKDDGTTDILAVDRVGGLSTVNLPSDKPIKTREIVEAKLKAPEENPLKKYIEDQKFGHTNRQVLKLNKEEGEKLLKESGFKLEDGYYVKGNKFVR